jgi:hypothetical protein
MALVGGGGSPNVAGGANPAGTGSSINYIGNHAYGYSGAIALDGTQDENTYMLFSTAGQYIVGTIQINNLDEGAGTDDMVYKIYFDDQLTQAYRVGGANVYTSPDNTIPILIPPFTRVKITIKDITQASTIKNIVSIVGEVYA